MRKRCVAMVEELRKAEDAREKLLDVKQMAGSYPDGHDMQVRLSRLVYDLCSRYRQGGGER